MTITGTDYIRSLVEEGGFVAKMVFNEAGAIIFPAAKEHRNTKAPGISYEDDYEGNALAAMLKPGMIEIRYHKGFSDERVMSLVSSLLASNELDMMKGWNVGYQGRSISET